MNRLCQFKTLPVILFAVLLLLALALAGNDMFTEHAAAAGSDQQAPDQQAPDQQAEGGILVDQRSHMANTWFTTSRTAVSATLPATVGGGWSNRGNSPELRSQWLGHPGVRLGQSSPYRSPDWAIMNRLSSVIC